MNLFNKDEKSGKYKSVECCHVSMEEQKCLLHSRRSAVQTLVFEVIRRFMVLGKHRHAIKIP